MAKKFALTIADDANACTAAYNVRYRRTIDQNWSYTPEQYDNVVVIDNLADNTEYEAEIRRRCCDGTLSNPFTVTFDTADQTQLSTPTGFTGGAGVLLVRLEWDEPEAEPPITYVIQRATDAGFTTDLATIYTGPWVTVYDDEGLTAGTLYYFRIKATSAGYLDSDYATTSATPLAS